jgi:predicted component of type VI protein secretion system
MNVTLVMVTGDGSAKELPIPKLPVTIGRGSECKLRVPLPAVSRTHCEILDEDDELVVRDLKSSNGTHVNRERVKQRELLPGDLLAVGPVVFVVKIDGHPKSIDAKDAWNNGSVATPGDGQHAPPVGAAAPGTSPSSLPTLQMGQRDAAPAAKPSASAPLHAPAASSAPKPAAQPPAAGPAKKGIDLDDELDDIIANLGDSDFDIGGKKS